jgi:Ni/Co efflux regulator RcnB
MKKTLIAFAACAISALAMSQPIDQRDGGEMGNRYGDHRTTEQRDMEHRARVERAMEQRNRGEMRMEEHHVRQERHHRTIWVPAHRTRDGRRVPGHHEQR